MATKYYKCKHCQAINSVSDKDFLQAIEENAGPIAAKAAIMLLATAITAPVGGLGGVVAGTLFTAEGARNYLSLECGKCKRRFFIKRWEA